MKACQKSSKGFLCPQAKVQTVSCLSKTPRIWSLSIPVAPHCPPLTPNLVVQTQGFPFSSLDLSPLLSPVFFHTCCPSAQNIPGVLPCTNALLSDPLNSTDQAVGSSNNFAIICFIVDVPPRGCRLHTNYFPLAQPCIPSTWGDMFTTLLNEQEDE